MQLSPRRTAVGGPLQLAGRGDALRGATSAVEGSGGAVIVGPEGIGKTALVNHVARAAGSGFHVVHVYGSAVSARTDYGPLNWLLSELPEMALGNPVQVLRGVKAHLAQLAAGRRTLLVVDNIHELDPLSQTVTVQLARQSAVALLATTPDILRCGEEMVRLWSDGVIRRIDLGPLGTCEAQALMEGVAGGRMSALAVRTVWAQTRGNPLFTSLLCRDQIAAGRIQDRGGTWALTGPMTYTGEISDWMETWYRQLPEQERRIVELASLCPGLPIDTLLAAADPDSLDSLEERGVLKVGHGDGAVSLREPLYARLVAGLIPVGRSYDLWQDIMDTGPDLSVFSDAPAKAYAEWSAVSGNAIPAELAQRACAAANRTGEPEAALKISAAVQAPQPALMLERARALAASDRRREAERDLLAVLDCQDRDTLVPALLELVRIARTLPQPAIAPRAALRQATEAAASLPEPERSYAQHSIVIAEAALAVQDAELEAVPEGLEALCTDRNATESARLTGRALRCQALALAGRTDDARDEASALWTDLQAADVPEVVGGEVLTGILCAYVQAGELLLALEVLNGSARLRYLDAHLGSWTELPAGAVHALSGRPDAALEYLLPALRQLEVRDPRDLLPLAYAATAYCYAAKQEWDKMGEYLAAAPKFKCRPAVHVASATKYFQAAAVLDRKSDPGSAAVLTEQGIQAQAKGCYPEAMVCFATAAVYGDGRAALLLESAAATGEGINAAMWRSLGTGLRQGSGRMLHDVAERLLHLGHFGLGHKTALAAHEAAAAGKDRDLARRARTVANECYRFLSEANSIERRLAALSEFERDLSIRAAGGESSARLGNALHLSPRTVDWHLGRIFQKLHVSGRAELRRLIGDQTGSRTADSEGDRK
ncbi:AAA family ATPase [Arthrobacter sp.]|uniref:AAA family ATPase n=1 Tax=Arthrobacter sp. TaxID=1667 RepID=UPI0028988B39|nr:AAA family ATPase [Arthrobacter sp.]